MCEDITQLKLKRSVGMNKKIKTIQMTRVVGYVRPVNLWNKGKRKEWQTRRLIGLSNFVGYSHMSDH